MELKGTVLNVVDFGAFIDIGLKDSGLVHISQMANRYVKSPYDVAAVGDVVTVWVLAVDKDRRRVSLTMIQPGTERKPPEKKPAPPRREGPPPPSGDRRNRNRPPQEGRRQPQGVGGRPQQGGRPPQGGGRPQQGGGGRGLPPRGVRRPPAGQQQGGRGPGPQGRWNSNRNGGSTTSSPAATAAPSDAEAKPVASGARRRGAARHVRRVGGVLGCEETRRCGASRGDDAAKRRGRPTAADVMAWDGGHEARRSPPQARLFFPQHPLQQHRIDLPSKSHLAVNHHHRHTFAVFLRQSRVAVHVHPLQREAVTPLRRRDDLPRLARTDGSRFAYRIEDVGRPLPHGALPAITSPMTSFAPHRSQPAPRLLSYR